MSNLAPAGSRQRVEATGPYKPGWLWQTVADEPFRRHGGVSSFGAPQIPLQQGFAAMEPAGVNANHLACVSGGCSRLTTPAKH
jgi:hypothetical protein